MNLVLGPAFCSRSTVNGDLVPLSTIPEATVSVSKKQSEPEEALRPTS